METENKVIACSQKQRNVMNWIREATPASFHAWLLAAANRCHIAGFPPEVAFKLLRVKANGHSRPVPSEEILRSIRKAYNGSGRAVATPPSLGPALALLSPSVKLRMFQGSKPWPKGFGLPELLACPTNAVKQLGNLSPGIMLHMLFGMPSNAGQRIVLVRKGETGMQHVNIPIQEFLHAPTGWINEGYNLVVPNLAIKKWGITHEGKWSTRSLDLFPRRQFLVLESDLGPDTWDTQAALIEFTARLLRRRPALVVHSGNKSLHSWWRAKGLDERPICDFVDKMAGLWDPASKTLNQCYRIPNARRGTEERHAGRCHEVLYANVDELFAGWKMGL
jgi:hypothetical protein